MQYNRFLLTVILILAAAVFGRASAAPLATIGQSACQDASGGVTSCAAPASAVITSPAATVTSIWGGARHCIVLKSDGSVWTWGTNISGNLGDGTVSIWDPVNPNPANERHTPIQVHGPGNIGTLISIKAIMGGEAHNFALNTDGAVWAWGMNSLGQLGDGTWFDRSTPVQVKGLAGVIALGGRGYHSLAITADHTVWAWGMNSSGQLGDGTTTNSNLPLHVGGLSNVDAVTGGYNFSLALKADHTLWGWGANMQGQLGDGFFTNRPAPVQVSISNVKQVSAGWRHAVAVKIDGTVWDWGLNASGQLGNATVVNSNLPVQVMGVSDVKAVSGGDCHTAALKNDGTVWTWGCNERGELGDGSFDAMQTTPVQVVGLSSVTAIAARDYHNIVLKADGTVWTWGFNENGQLGDNGTTNSSIPVQVIFPPFSEFMPLVFH